MHIFFLCVIMLALSDLGSAAAERRALRWKGRSNVEATAARTYKRRRLDVTTGLDTAYYSCGKAGKSGGKSGKSGNGKSGAGKSGAGKSGQTRRRRQLNTDLCDEDPEITETITLQVRDPENVSNDVDQMEEIYMDTIIMQQELIKQEEAFIEKEVAVVQELVEEITNGYVPSNDDPNY